MERINIVEINVTHLSSRANGDPTRGMIIRTWDFAAGCMWLLKLSVLIDKLMAESAVNSNVIKLKKVVLSGILLLKATLVNSDRPGSQNERWVPTGREHAEA